MTSVSSEQIKANVAGVKRRIAAAAARSGRKAEDITLVGVTKTQSPEAVRALIQAGVPDIGENRVQELLEKEPFLSDLPHKTHLIGHLQRNKVKFLPGHIQMLQSLDSPKTLETLEQFYTEYNSTLDVLIEVNIGGEANKNGVSPEELPALAARVAASKNLILRGLMAIPPMLDAHEVRPYFRQMLQLFVDIRAKKMDNDTVNILSMGMSSDFEAAIEEGATMVRVGTVLFGPRAV